MGKPPTLGGRSLQYLHVHDRPFSLSSSRFNDAVVKLFILVRDSYFPFLVSRKELWF